MGAARRSPSKMPPQERPNLDGNLGANPTKITSVHTTATTQRMVLRLPCGLSKCSDSANMERTRNMARQVATVSNLDTVSNRHTVSKVTELLVMDARQAMDNNSSSSSSRMGVMVPVPGKRVQGTVKRPTHAIRLIESHVQRFDDKRTCETKI